MISRSGDTWRKLNPTDHKKVIHCTDLQRRFAMYKTKTWVTMRHPLRSVQGDHAVCASCCLPRAAPSEPMENIRLRGDALEGLDSAVRKSFAYVRRSWLIFFRFCIIKSFTRPCVIDCWPGLYPGLSHDLYAGSFTNPRRSLRIFVMIHLQNLRPERFRPLTSKTR